jgi:hypothetical protein
VGNDQDGGMYSAPEADGTRARDSDSKGPGRLQILHYNIDRFPNEIKDLRGLETLLVAR